MSLRCVIGVVTSKYILQFEGSYESYLAHYFLNSVQFNTHCLNHYICVVFALASIKVLLWHVFHINTCTSIYVF